MCVNIILHIFEIAIIHKICAHSAMRVMVIYNTSLGLTVYRTVSLLRTMKRLGRGKAAVRLLRRK